MNKLYDFSKGRVCWLDFESPTHVFSKGRDRILSYAAWQLVSALLSVATLLPLLRWTALVARPTCSLQAAVSLLFRTCRRTQSLILMRLLPIPATEMCTDRIGRQDGH